MTKSITTADSYIASLPEERKASMTKLRNLILKNLPKGFQEGINYGMISYHVPHSIYPNGYHCKPADPLPFINLASQKNFIAIYHMGLYMDPKLMKWFTDKYAATVKGKLDMGKSCIRFKKPDSIPFDLIGELVSKISVKDWISTYEEKLKR